MDTAQGGLPRGLQHLWRAVVEAGETHAAWVGR